jgi:hypothetical protein
VSDHITSVRLGLKKRNPLDMTMPGVLKPMLIYVETIDYVNELDQPERTAFVILSMTDEKTAWATAEVERVVYKAAEDIMSRCQHYQHWSDHGGSNCTEDI